MPIGGQVRSGRGARIAQAVYFAEILARCHPRRSWNDPCVSAVTAIVYAASDWLSLRSKGDV